MNLIAILLILLLAINALAGICKIIWDAKIINDFDGIWHIDYLIEEITSILISILFCIIILYWYLHGCVL